MKRQSHHSAGEEKQVFGRKQPGETPKSPHAASFFTTFLSQQLFCPDFFFFMCVSVFALLIGGWGKPSFPNPAWPRAQLERSARTQRCSGKKKKKKGKQLEKLNKRPALCQAGCARQGTLEGMDRLCFSSVKLGKLWNAYRRVGGGLLGGGGKGSNFWNHSWTLATMSSEPVWPAWTHIPACKIKGFLRKNLQH